MCGITGDGGFVVGAASDAAASFAGDVLKAIFTASAKALEPMKELFRSRECGVDLDDQRIVIVSGKDVPGFEAGALGK